MFISVYIPTLLLYNQKAMSGNQKDNRLERRVEAHIRKQQTMKYCEGCGSIMQYSYVAGRFLCDNCGYSELDTYGRILELMERYPRITFPEVSKMLDIPFRELNAYIKDGVIVNPLLPDWEDR